MSPWFRVLSCPVGSAERCHGDAPVRVQVKWVDSSGRLHVDCEVLGKVCESPSAELEVRTCASHLVPSDGVGSLRHPFVIPSSSELLSSSICRMALFSFPPSLVEKCVVDGGGGKKGKERVKMSSQFSICDLVWMVVEDDQNQNQNQDQDQNPSY